MFTPNSLSNIGMSMVGNIDGVLFISYSFCGISGKLLLNQKNESTSNKLFKNYRIYVDRNTPIPDNVQGDPITYLLRLMREEAMKVAKAQDASVLIIIDGINETIQPILLADEKIEGRPVINIDEDMQEITIGG